ncbi:hypothetical protein ACFQ0B_03200 [Nonomuraea thailandensis]
MTGEDERQFARALISQVLEEHARSEIGLGRTPPTVEEEEALAAGIHAALFGVGGCSRCSTTARSRTSTSTAATGCSSATPTARS